MFLKFRTVINKHSWIVEYGDGKKTGKDTGMATYVQVMQLDEDNF